MIDNIKGKRVYAYCLASVVTGGCELIHQLVDYLNNHSCEAYIVYVGRRAHEIPEAYSGYNVKVADKIDDSENSVVVCGEGFLYLASKVKSAQVILWWLSVDNAYNDGVQLPYMSLVDVFKWNKRTVLRAIKLRLKNKVFDGYFSLNQMKEMRVINGYQSEYARLYLEEKGFDRLIPLKDYINTDYINDYDISNFQRAPKVLYNPRKGFEYTRKLIEAAPDICWVPIQNMNRTQILDVLHSSMLYVDFGNHPGKDRLPREAALNGCCVLTGRRGAAWNDVDICIPSKYKFDEKAATVSEVVNMIRNILDHYDECTSDFDGYRQSILGEKEEFEHQIDSLFGL